MAVTAPRACVDKAAAALAQRSASGQARVTVTQDTRLPLATTLPKISHFLFHSWTEFGKTTFFRSPTLVICKRLLPRHKTPRLTAMLFQQRDAIDGHAPVHGFAHIVDGEQGNLHGGEGVIQINNCRHRLNALPLFLLDILVLYKFGRVRSWSACPHGIGRAQQYGDKLSLL
jgi:hypothetical protein